MLAHIPPRTLKLSPAIEIHGTSHFPMQVEPKLGLCTRVTFPSRDVVGEKRVFKGFAKAILQLSKHLLRYMTWVACHYRKLSQLAR